LAIHFFSETTKFRFNRKRITTNWLKKVITSYKREPGDISVVFCSDEQLLEINKQYLKHSYFTDVITFNYNYNDVISGDIYISIDRISENARNFNVSFDKELNRVIVHGILHLLGFNDKKSSEKEKMRELEDLHLKEI
jgi:rRNA maturation RNase YbeY